MLLLSKQQVVCNIWMHLKKRLPENHVHNDKRGVTTDLAKEAREHEIVLVSFDSKEPDRITVRYTEDGNPKKVYFSSSLGEWKINYKAGRQKPDDYFKAAI